MLLLAVCSCAPGPLRHLVTGCCQGVCWTQGRAHHLVMHMNMYKGYVCKCHVHAWLMYNRHVHVNVGWCVVGKSHAHQHTGWRPLELAKSNTNQHTASTRLPLTHKKCRNTHLTHTRTTHTHTHHKHNNTPVSAAVMRARASSGAERGRACPERNGWQQSCRATAEDEEKRARTGKHHTHAASASDVIK